MIKKSKLNPKVAEVAKRLHAEAVANGTLKAPKPLGVLRLTNGPSRAAGGSTTTWRDYMPEARQALSQL